MVRKSQYSEAQQTVFVHNLAQDLVLHFWEYHALGLKVQSGTTEEECSVFPPKPRASMHLSEERLLPGDKVTAYLMTGILHRAIANGLNRSTV